MCILNVCVCVFACVGICVYLERPVPYLFVVFVRVCVHPLWLLRAFRAGRMVAEIAATSISHATLDFVIHIKMVLQIPPLRLKHQASEFMLCLLPPLRIAAAIGTPSVCSNKKGILDTRPPNGKADMTKGASNRSPKRGPEKDNSASGQQAGRMGGTPDLLRDDFAPTPTDLGLDLGVCRAFLWSLLPAHATMVTWRSRYPARRHKPTSAHSLLFICACALTHTLTNGYTC